MHARNPGTPREVLERLRGDPWEEVRQTVEERLA
jgi:leucine rich repeat (LRR) protein